MMLCRNPYVDGAAAYGCGQCMPCRFNRRRIWSHRILLEAKQYEDNAFVTLSYDDEHLPANGSLAPADIQLWLKRLRFKYAPKRLRFFIVGEYGDDSSRPHYHAALFNFPACKFGMSQFGTRGKSCCVVCDSVRDSWGKGLVFLGSLQRESAAYISGYVVKKMTHKDDPRLDGRYPEFARMSLKPGIGGDAMFEVADVVMRYDTVGSEGDVPSGLRHGKFVMPLGRYLQKRVRKLIGVDENAPQVVLDKIQAEVLPLRAAARASEENPSWKSHLVESTRGRYEQFEARRRIFKRKGSL